MSENESPAAVPVEDGGRCRWCEVDVARHSPDGAWWHVRSHRETVGVHTPEPAIDGEEEQ